MTYVVADLSITVKLVCDCRVVSL